jgi:hypothetical protein
VLSFENATPIDGLVDATMCGVVPATASAISTASCIAYRDHHAPLRRVA